MKSKLLIFLIALSTLCQSQTFRMNLSGTWGPINSKFRVQSEFPIKKRGGFGINMNYYLKNWKGPIFEPFIRVYKSDSNIEGTFFQAKILIGQLSKLEYTGHNETYNLSGFGLSFGDKYLVYNNFIIEYLIGIRYLSNPNFIWSTGDYLIWYTSTGFPIDFNLKFGYQF